MFGKRPTPPKQPGQQEKTPPPKIEERVANHLSKPRENKSEGTVQPPKETETAVAPSLSADSTYYDVKTKVFDALLDTIDLTQLGRMEAEAKRGELEDVCREIIAVKGFVISPSKEEQLIRDICNDLLGLGPLEPLLARDDISDIMVNGADKVYIETGGLIQLTDVKFRDNAQLMNICQRIVSAIGRRVDESNPICDARLADGSRVNVIAPPLSLEGPTLTIRKFRRERYTFDELIRMGTLSENCATVIRIAAASRCNILVSGGTGSGKTTMLNCLTRYIGQGERIVTCEDAAELQLQQPHVVRLETRPPNIEGKGEVTMRDLVRNCLRMRPDRIIVGEVRGPEAFELLQAMNTGHDGSMGTLHANSPREATSRLENMIAMGGFTLPAKAVREQIAAAMDMIVHVQRLRDGSRKITHITEVMGMEGDVIVMQDLFQFEFLGEDEQGRIVGRHKATGLRPKFLDKANYFGLGRELMTAIEEVS